MTKAPRMIPARLTVRRLADEIDQMPGRVLEELARHGHALAVEDVIGAELAIDVAKSFAVELNVESRDLALEQLYEYETKGELASEPGGRAGAIVEGVVSSVDELDQMIESVAERWSVARMPVIDRNIIRMGLYELTGDAKTPTAVILAEATRLAQAYSTERSAPFVNGVLATLAETVRES